MPQPMGAESERRTGNGRPRSRLARHTIVALIAVLGLTLIPSARPAARATLALVSPIGHVPADDPADLSCRDRDRSWVELPVALAGAEIGRVFHVSDGTLAVLVVVTAANRTAEATMIDFAGSLDVGAVIVRAADAATYTAFDPPIRALSGLSAPDGAGMTGVSFCYRVRMPSAPPPGVEASPTVARSATPTPKATGLTPSPRATATRTPSPVATAITFDLDAVPTASALAVTATSAAATIAAQATEARQAEATMAAHGSAAAQAQGTTAAQATDAAQLQETIRGQATAAGQAQATVAAQATSAVQDQATIANQATAAAQAQATLEAQATAAAAAVATNQALATEAAAQATAASGAVAAQTREAKVVATSAALATTAAHAAATAQAAATALQATAAALANEIAATPPATVLYAAGDAEAFAAWALPAGWTAGEVLSSSDQAEGQWLTLPFQVADRTDYAVAADIRVAAATACQRNFGLGIRGSDAGYYAAGIEWRCDPTQPVARIWAGSEILAERDLAVDDNWHTYRVEVEGNRIRFLLDGTLILEATDDRYPSGGQVAVWSAGVALDLREFRVVTLPGSGGS